MRRKRRRKAFDFEVVPVNLIDLFLVILIFFITTTTFLNIRSIDLNLPKSKSAQPPSYLNVMVLNVDKKGDLFLDTKPYSFDRIIKKLRKIKRDSPKTVFQLAADKDSIHSNFIKAMDALSAAGIENFAIATKE